VAARLPQLMVDPILIEQVLINLMKNGADSILQAQRPVSQNASLKSRFCPARSTGADVVEFSGSGHWKRCARQSCWSASTKLFTARKAEGMGIGLKLCRSIIESHHGRIQVQNIYNGNEISGCVFSFWIPVNSPLKAGTA
jgi:K+-sensing histidine kinase KdpD